MRYTHDTSTPGKHILKVDQIACIAKIIEQFELEDTRWQTELTPLPILSSTDDLIVAMGGDNVFKDEKPIDWSKKFS